MADIKQAAKWMQEGKSVRRPMSGSFSVEYNGYFPDGIKSGKDSDGLTVPVCICHDEPKLLRLESLLAEDWEIVEDDNGTH